MIKHYLYYFTLAIIAMSAIDLVFDGWFRFVLYFVLGWAIPPYGEQYDAIIWELKISESDWANNKIWWQNEKHRID